MLPPLRCLLTWRACLSLFAALVAILTVSACADPAEPTASNGQSKAFERILLTNASAVDFVHDLVGLDKVIAIPADFDDYTNVGGLDAFGPEQRFKEFNAEIILGLNPDLVVAGSWVAAESVKHLREAGVDVYVMPTVVTLDDIRATIRELGARMSAEAQATNMLQAFDAKVAALNARAAARSAKATALSYTNYGSGGWTAGAGTTADLILNLAGVINVAAEAGRTGHDLVDFESMFAWDADWIIVSKPSSAYGMTKAYLENEAALSNLRAIQAGHIAEVPAALYSTTSHYLLDGAEALEQLIYGPAK